MHSAKYVLVIAKHGLVHTRTQVCPDLRGTTHGTPCSMHRCSNILFRVGTIDAVDQPYDVKEDLHNLEEEKEFMANKPRVDGEKLLN